MLDSDDAGALVPFPVPVWPLRLGLWRFGREGQTAGRAGVDAPPRPDDDGSSVVACAAAQVRGRVGAGGLHAQGGPVLQQRMGRTGRAGGKGDYVGVTFLCCITTHELK